MKKLLGLLISIVMLFQLTGCTNTKAVSAYEHLQEAEKLMNERIETLYEAVSYGRSITQTSTGIRARFAEIFGCSEQELKTWSTVFEDTDSKLANTFWYHPDGMSFITCYLVSLKNGEREKLVNELEFAKEAIMEIENSTNGLYEELMAYYDCLKDCDDNFPKTASDTLDKTKIEGYQMSFKKHRLAIDDKM